MNPSTAMARVLVDELVTGGVTEVVLSPGSRSAALALALADAEDRGELRLHVRVDERSAGFLALGLAKVSRQPVAVVVTSGSAVANLAPAMIEASYAGVPLIALTADRPPELRDTGANQTIDQVGFFGSAVRWSHDLAVAEERLGQVRYWRSVVSRAIAVSAESGDPGPVHVNVAFREPLVPGDDDAWVEPLALFELTTGLRVLLLREEFLGVPEQGLRGGPIRRRRIAQGRPRKRDDEAEKRSSDRSDHRHHIRPPSGSGAALWGRDLGDAAAASGRAPASGRSGAWATALGFAAGEAEGAGK